MFNHPALWMASIRFGVVMNDLMRQRMLGQVSGGELGEIPVAGHAWGVSCGRLLLAANASVSMFARKFGRNAARTLLAEVAIQILSVIA